MPEKVLSGSDFTDFGGAGRSFRGFRIMPQAVADRSSSSNSRSFTPNFVVCFSVLLFCFDMETIKHSAIQSVGYSSSLVCYMRARELLLGNLPEF